MGMRFLFIDAHNVIFSCPDLKALLLRNQDAARDALVERSYQFMMKIFRVVLVLDSRQAFSAFMRTPEGSSFRVCLCTCRLICGWGDRKDAGSLRTA